MKSPYDILGVAKTASADEIKKAFRKRAKNLHPDLNPGDRQAEELFKELSLANEILSDPEKRKRFDKGEIDGLGADIPRPSYYKDYADRPGAAHSYENRSGFADFSDVGDLFEQMRARQNAHARNMPGSDIHYELTVDFLDAVKGCIKTVSIGNGATLDIRIPVGASDEDIVRVKGKGQSSADAGKSGDALVTLYIKPHPYFSRVENDIHLDLPLTIQEAILGAKIKVPTPFGAVILNIPKASSTGAKLRIKGKGIAGKQGAGDEIVTLKIMMPKTSDDALTDFMTHWHPTDLYEPRKEMGL